LQGNASHRKHGVLSKSTIEEPTKLKETKKGSNMTAFELMAMLESFSVANMVTMARTDRGHTSCMQLPRTQSFSSMTEMENLQELVKEKVEIYGFAPCNEPPEDESDDSTSHFYYNPIGEPGFQIGLNLAFRKALVYSTTSSLNIVAFKPWRCDKGVDTETFLQLFKEIHLRIGKAHDTFFQKNQGRRTNRRDSLDSGGSVKGRRGSLNGESGGRRRPSMQCETHEVTQTGRRGSVQLLSPIAGPETSVVQVGKVKIIKDECRRTGANGRVSPKDSDYSSSDSATRYPSPTSNPGRLGDNGQVDKTLPPGIVVAI